MIRGLSIIRRIQWVNENIRGIIILVKIKINCRFYLKQILRFLIIKLISYQKKYFIYSFFNSDHFI